MPLVHRFFAKGHRRHHSKRGANWVDARSEQENKTVDRESATKGAKIGEYLKRERYKYTKRKQITVEMAETREHSGETGKEIL
ncbi:predicted protein [Histoplasma mississippiense (nom. inval.)]|uniref:predicted protein n=1 Tax=Ajellomyces capsulatus (strain NAm1 / WU24) TaxID=2059318 RepID=UPI000157C4A0|nr:predicted protein [Histoplasma mississippiense (nom. inval.)]EDN08937.1 predicted protein [Histoplasma mississippiense (nom. inval.)]